MVLYACSQCNRRKGAVIIGMRLTRRTKALTSLGEVLRGLLCLERSLRNMSGVSVLPYKSADDSVIHVQVDTNISTGHPCPMHPNHLPSDIIRYASPWHIKIVTLSNLLSTYKSQEFAFTILRFSNLYPFVFQPLAGSRRDTRTA